MTKLLALLLLIPLLVATASASTGINVIPILTTNSTGGALIAPRIPWNMSSQQLVTGAWMNATALNTELQDAGVGIGYMPGTGQVRMLACFNNAGGDETTACNNATAGDITLPAGAAQVYEFAGDSQFRHLWLNLSIAGVATWDLTFEYYNGVSYVALTGVTDATNELIASGLNQITWAFPAEDLWDQASLHAITGYWMRIRVSAFTSLTTAPLGQQAYYETGRWWTTVPTIADNEQRRFDLHLDTSPTDETTTTFSIAATTDDARVVGFEVSGAYPPPFDSVSDVNPLTVSRDLSGGNYLIVDAYLRFDTSALPDQISPDSATLACYISEKVDSVDNRFLVGEWYPWSGALGEKDYNVTATARAISGVDITAITTSAVNTWTLDYLHRINKSGYSGLRLSINGLAPTAQNQISIQGFGATPSCVLSVTYNGSRAYHDFFPHTAGYTLADNAALEPGMSFSMTLTGFFDANVPNGTDIISKGTAIEWTKAPNNVITVFVNGVAEADFTGVTTGYHSLTARQVDSDAASRLEAIVDGVITDTSTGVATVPNNATTWTFDVALPYQEYFTLKVGNGVQLFHQIQSLPTHQLINQEPDTLGTFDVTVRYPDTETDLTVTVLPLEPTGAFGDVVPPSGDFVAPIGELTNLIATEHLNEPTFLPFVLLKWGADRSGGALPYQAMLILVAFILCIVAMLGSWYALHSVHVTWVALFAASISFVYVGSGIWTWMIPFSIGITLLVYVFYRRAAV